MVQVDTAAMMMDDVFCCCCCEVKFFYVVDDDERCRWPLFALDIQRVGHDVDDGR